jgi:hypothetical protein
MFDHCCQLSQHQLVPMSLIFVMPGTFGKGLYVSYELNLLEHFISVWVRPVSAPSKGPVAASHRQFFSR